MKAKISSLVIFLSIFFSSLIFAQYPQMDFPLQVGNRWQYSEVPGSYSESQAIKDTLMPNGMIYIQIQGELFSGFFRSGESKVFKYNSSSNDESIYYNFSKKTGDTLSFYLNDMDTIVTTVYEEGTHLIFGEQKYYMSFITKYSSSTAYGIQYITDGLGFTSYNGEVLSYGLSGAIINGNQYGIVLKVEDEEINHPKKYELSQNYPNPFNPITKISFSISKLSNIRLSVFDILGNEIAILVNEEKIPGNYEVSFDGYDLTSGLYFYRITAGEYKETKKMILVK